MSIHCRTVRMRTLILPHGSAGGPSVGFTRGTFAFDLASIEVLPLATSISLDKLQPEAQIPTHPAKQRANSAVTRSVVCLGNQRLRPSSRLSKRLDGFTGGSHGNCNWSFRFA
jgi:hypothetical protein